MGSALNHSLDDFKQEGYLDELHIVTKSLRNGYYLITRHLMNFVLHRSHWVPRDPDIDGVRMFWALLGVESHMLDFVCEVNPHWDGEQLLVSSLVASHEDPTGSVYDCLFYIFKWRVLNEARFIGSREVCGTIVASLECGMERLVHITRTDPGLATVYHLHGFSGLSTSLKKICVLTAISGWVSESASFVMIEEPRLVRYSFL